MKTPFRPGWSLLAHGRGLMRVVRAVCLAACLVMPAVGFAAEATAHANPLSTVEDTWTTDTGAKVRLADLKGRVQVVSLFYSSCHMTCPLTLVSMRQVEAALPAELRAQTGFVLITFLPEIDTVRVLHRFRGEQNLSARWTLLRGSDAATRKAADALGVAFRTDSFRLSHSPQIAVLDAEGRIIFRQRDLRASSAPLVNAVRSALNAKSLTAQK